MTKRLLLLRHAKAVPHAADDFGRALAPRGHSDMALMAKVLAEPSLSIDLALVSPAARTRETWADAERPDVPVRFLPALYGAAAETLLEIVRAGDEAVSALVLVGHNPGLEDVARWLVGRAETVSEERALLGGMPTAALVVIDWAIDTWASVAPGQGTLVRLVTPEMLGGGP